MYATRKANAGPMPRVPKKYLEEWHRGGLRGFRVLALLALGRSLVVGGQVRRHRCVIERHTAPQRGAQRRHLALQPRIVLARAFQRAFGHRALHALALQRRTEFLDALFDLLVGGASRTRPSG